jgi:hypothetical protein
MAVLIEALSVVIRLETVADKYPGGVEQYIEDCPNHSLCLDDDLVRVGFMTGCDALDFIRSLERLGFKHIGDYDEFDELAVVDQHDGIVRPCDWLEYANVVIFKGDLRISVCKITGSAIDSIAFPAGWVYENSLSKKTIALDPAEFDGRMTFLRREGNVYFYHDKVTGMETFVKRTIIRNANA